MNETKKKSGRKPSKFKYRAVAFHLREHHIDRIKALVLAARQELIERDNQAALESNKTLPKA